MIHDGNKYQVIGVDDNKELSSLIQLYQIKLGFKKLDENDDLIKQSIEKIPEIKPKTNKKKGKPPKSKKRKKVPENDEDESSNERMSTRSSKIMDTLQVIENKVNQIQESEKNFEKKIKEKIRNQSKNDSIYPPNQFPYKFQNHVVPVYPSQVVPNCLFQDQMFQNNKLDNNLENKIKKWKSKFEHHKKMYKKYKQKLKQFNNY